MIKYELEFFEEEKVILRTFIGKVNEEILSESWEDILESESFNNSGYNLLTDYSNARIDVDIEKLDLAKSSYSKIFDVNPDFFHAVVVQNEDDSVYCFLMETEMANYKTFSTMKAAFNWLSLKS